MATAYYGWFPSPYGEDKGFIMSWFVDMESVKDSFRPLTGNIKILYLELEEWTMNYIEFPSPYGEYKDFISNMKSVQAKVERFPSPYGEYKDFIERFYV